jgi:hypothetical protein
MNRQEFQITGISIPFHPALGEENNECSSFSVPNPANG